MSLGQSKAFQTLEGGCSPHAPCTEVLVQTWSSGKADFFFPFFFPLKWKWWFETPFKSILTKQDACWQARLAALRRLLI